MVCRMSDRESQTGRSTSLRETVTSLLRSAIPAPASPPKEPLKDDPDQQGPAPLKRSSNPLWSIAAFVVVVYGVHAASAVLAPVVGAAILAAIVAPAVRWLEKRRVPRVVAVLFIVLGLVAGLIALAAIAIGSLGGLKESAPEYGARLRDIFVALNGWLDVRGVDVDFSALFRKKEPAVVAEEAATFVIDSWSACCPQHPPCSSSQSRWCLS